SLPGATAPAPPGPAPADAARYWRRSARSHSQSPQPSAHPAPTRRRSPPGARSQEPALPTPAHRTTPPSPAHSPSILKLSLEDLKIKVLWKLRISPADQDGCRTRRRRGQFRDDVKTLVLLNDPAYGTERSYNGLRLAHSLAKRDGEDVRIFLLADAVSCALAGQQ